MFIIPQRESNSSMLFTAHGHGKFDLKVEFHMKNKYLYLEHMHSLIDHPHFILHVGIYATISNCLLGIAILCK